MHDWDRIKEFHRGIKEIPDDNGCTCIKINYYIGSVILCQMKLMSFDSYLILTYSTKSIKKKKSDKLFLIFRIG